MRSSMADDEGSEAAKSRASEDEGEDFLRAVAASPSRAPDSTRGEAPTRLAHFRIVGRLGSGGMGVVYRAHDETLQRDVALKVLPSISARDPERRKRFLREARVAASLVHPNVAVVYQVGEAEGRVYIAMELVDGTTLRSRLSGGALLAATAREWAVQMAQGLAAAHAKGIVHRDLKPENVMVTPTNVAKLLDFGLAKSGWATDSESELGTADTEAQITREGEILGSSAYMSPEQALGLALDARSDVFSFGIVLYEMLCGRRPFGGKTPGEVRAAIARDEPLAPDPDVDAELGQVAMRCLAKKVDERFVDAGAVLGALAPQVPTNDLERSGRASSAVSRSTHAPPRPRRSVRARTMALGLLGVALVGGGVFAYGAARAPRVRYCVSRTHTSDGPRCAFERSADSLPKRFFPIFRFTEQGERAVRVETLSVGGVPIEREDWIRDDSGAVREVKVYDRFGANTRWERWSDGGRRVDYVDIDGKTPRHEHRDDRVTSEQRELDSERRLARIQFFGASGRPRPVTLGSGGDNVGAYGLTSKYGKTPGYYTEEAWLGPDGAPATNAQGFASVRREDTGIPFPDGRFFDLDGRPAVSNGFHRIHIFTEDDDFRGAAFFGLHDEPVLLFSQGLHEYHQEWDPTKRVLRETVLDANGHTPPLVRGLWITSDTQFYDDHGNLVRVEYLDGQGNRVVTNRGAAVDRYKYDEQGHETLFEELDVAGNLVQNVDGFARREEKRDAHDNPLEYRYYDETGHLAPWKEGGTIVRATFDDRDLKLTSSSFDAQERPIADIHGVFSEHDRYDRLRNLVEVAYFGTDGKPAVSDEGFAFKRFTYDQNDDLVSVSYFDTSGAPTLASSSYATTTLKNDENGLPIEEHFLDVHGDATLTKEAYASVTRQRSRDGDVIEESYFGKRGEPVLREGGYARKTTTYDVRRRPIEIALFDAAGTPVRGTDGWSVERTTYDENGLLIRIDHLDASRTLALDAKGRASVVKTYDARANLTDESTLGADGKPVVTPEGFATKRTTYDERDEVVAEELLGSDGKATSGKAGWSVRRVRYDDFGNMVEEAFFDETHAPVAPKEIGYASKRQRFDARRRLIEVAYFDVRGVPSKGPEGAAIVRYERDGYGRAVETRYLDGMRMPAPSKDGCLVLHSKFDDAGRLVDERFVDADGAARPANDGCAGHHTAYDALGRKIEETCLDTKAGPTFSTSGWAVRRTVHDAHGNSVEIATFAPDGTLHGDKDKIARTENQFDERNLITETAFFDDKGKRAHDASGAYIRRFTYDEAGKKTAEQAFDAREHLVSSKAAPRH